MTKVAHIPNHCPECSTELEWQSNNKQNDSIYLCPYCNSKSAGEVRSEALKESYWVKLSFCPDCKNQMERLKACGSVGYFCPSCNEQKSKSRVLHEFKAI